MKMRSIMNLLHESDGQPAERFIEESDAALISLEGHVDALLLVKGPRLVEIADFSATPMKAGWGSKGLKILCDLADRHGVRLIGRIANDGDSPWASSEDMPSEDALAEWYGRFGFDVSDGGDDLLINRAPKSTS